MKPEIKQLWVNALRSGRYKQSRCHLRSNTGYCCLGVLVDCYVQQKEEKHSWEWTLDDFDCLYYIPGLHEKYTPEFLPNAKDFRDWTGRIPVEHEHALTQMNDWKANDFNEIADYIEENL